ncbi:hypothetical protein FKW77_006847 [Venturia effusa]|uniref:Uncharacterized protein n=1 Tax=Venturia effusa TaxID=50376 RepID=A0A517LPB3_9PEZI|nr:hypothetical protein FKW77_006847 [Venturia effusa]
MTTNLLALPRELRQKLLLQTFSFTSAPFRAYYRIDVIEGLIDRYHAMRTWSTSLRCVHSLLNTDIDFVIKQWQTGYRMLLDDITSALVGSGSCWLSKFDAAPVLSVDAVVVEFSGVAVRPPVFGWDASSGRYCVYEGSVARWEKAGWMKGSKLRTMKQVQRGRGRTISFPVLSRRGRFLEGVRTGSGDCEVVDGEEVGELEVEQVVRGVKCGMARLATKAGGIFRIR